MRQGETPEVGTFKVRFILAIFAHVTSSQLSPSHYARGVRLYSARLPETIWIICLLLNVSP